MEETREVVRKVERSWSSIKTWIAVWLVVSWLWLATLSVVAWELTTRIRWVERYKDQGMLLIERSEYETLKARVKALEAKGGDQDAADSN